MSKKQIFFTSDWHIGHENSIKFDNRPFKDLDDMHRQLIKNFNNTVPVDGLTYFLGDIATHGSELTKSIIEQLNGKKVLILGNHDKGSQACYNMGFDVVLNNAMIMIQKEHVTMSHCPLRGLYREDTSGMRGASEGELWHGEHRHPDFSIPNYGQFHLQGHIHSPNGGKSQKILKRQFDVGLPANKYRPVHINEIEQWIMLTKNKELTDKKD
jgi:calcineurin-like phosphoesterase family protein